MPAPHARRARTDERVARALRCRAYIALLNPPGASPCPFLQSTASSPDTMPMASRSVASNGPLSTIRELESIPGMIFHEVWETRGTPAPVDNGPDPTDGPLSHQAPKHGTRIRFVDFPPDSSYLAEAEARMKELFKEVNDVNGLDREARFAAPDDAPERSGRLRHRHRGRDDAGARRFRGAAHARQRRGPARHQPRLGEPLRRSCAACCIIQINGQYEPSIAAALARR